MKFSDRETLVESF